MSFVVVDIHVVVDLLVSDCIVVYLFSYWSLLFRSVRYFLQVFVYLFLGESLLLSIFVLKCLFLCVFLCVRFLLLLFAFFY